MYASNQTEKRRGGPDRSKRATCSECGKEGRASNIKRHYKLIHVIKAKRGPAPTDIRKAEKKQKEEKGENPRLNKKEVLLDGMRL